MKISLDPNDTEFLEQLNRIGPGTVQEICEAVGVTATAVRQRLARLGGLGLISRELSRVGRGRPRHVYRVTEAGQKHLGDNYADLALILWRELRRVEDAAVRDRILHRVCDALVDQYADAVQAASLPERMSQLRGAMVERGFDVEVDDSGELPILRENNCPYHDLASADSGICELEQEVFKRVLGAHVRLTQCCLEGHTCCEFQAGGRRGD